MGKYKHHFKEPWKRSLAKAAVYRVFILLLDFTVVYILTRRYDIALGFMVISKIYTTVGYYAHERVWDRIKWGKVMTKNSSNRR